MGPQSPNIFIVADYTNRRYFRSKTATLTPHQKKKTKQKTRKQITSYFLGCYLFQFFLNTVFDSMHMFKKPILSDYL